MAAWGIFVLCACVVIAARATWQDALTQKIDRDGWFGADTTRVLRDMFDLHANHYRSKVHPLFMAFTMPVATLLERVLHLRRYAATTAINAVLAGTWSLLLFRTLRSIGVGRLDAGLFAGVGMASSAALFWFSVPETYPLGAISLMLPLWLVARHPQHPVRDASLVVAGAFSLGITITNFVTGALSALVSRPLRRAVALCALMVTLATAAWAVEKVAIPGTGGFFLRGQGEEKSYLFNPKAGGPLRCLRVILSHGIVMPELALGDDGDLGIQRSPMFGGAVQSVGVVCWLALLGLGLVSLLGSSSSSMARTPVRLALLGATLAQLVLHLAYGEETFLYTLHTTTLLMLVAGWAGQGRWRMTGRILAIVLLVVLPVNNVSRLMAATRATLSAVPAVELAPHGEGR
jgi:hypothetical protein